MSERIETERLGGDVSCASRRRRFHRRVFAMHRFQRNLILSCGTTATKLAHQVMQKCANVPSVAHIVVGADQAESTPELDLFSAVESISSTDVQTTMAARGEMMDRLDEVAIWMILDTTEPTNIAAVLATRQRLRELVWRHLRCTTITHGMLISSPYLDEKTSDVVHSLQALLQPLDSLILVSTVNADGLVLPQEDRNSRLAEVMVRMLTTPLRDLPTVFVEQMIPPWQTDAVSENYPAHMNDNDQFVSDVAWEMPPLISIGASVYDNPVEALIDAFSRRWTLEAMSVLATAMAQKSPLTGKADEKLDADLIPWQPQRLSDELSVMLDPEHWFLNGDVYQNPGLQQIQKMVATLRRDYGQADVEMQRIRRQACAYVSQRQLEWEKALENRVGEELALHGEMFGVPALRRYLQYVHKAWIGWAETQDQRLQAAESVRGQQLTQLQETESVLSTLVAQFSLPGFSALFGFLLRPWKVFRLLQSYLSLSSITDRYVMQANAWIATETDCIQADLVRQYCLTAAESVSAVLQNLEALADVLQRTHDRIASENTKMYCDTVFDHTACERLYLELLGDGLLPLRRCLEHNPLSQWSQKNPEEIVCLLKSFACRWLAPLHDWSAEDFLTYAMEDDPAALADWFQMFLAEASPWWPAHNGIEGVYEPVTALILSGYEKNPLLPLIRRMPGVVHVAVGRTSDPLMAVRLQRLTTCCSQLMEG